MKKIEIATELVNMMSNNNKLRGGKEYDDDHKSRMVAKYTNSTKAELDGWLANETERNARLLKSNERDRKVKEFKASEEGLKAAAELHCAIKNWTNDIADEIHTIIEEALGSKWEAYSITSTGFEVGMLDNDGNIIFGYSFPVRFGYDLRASEAGWDEYFKFQANVGTMGEFEIDGNERQEFYIGFGKFLASEKVNNELKNELKQYTDNVRDAREAYKSKKEAYIAK